MTGTLPYALSAAWAALTVLGALGATGLALDALRRLALTVRSTRRPS